jgi:hypothetical protein
LKDKRNFSSKSREGNAFHRKKKTRANVGLDEDKGPVTSGNW